MRLITVPFQMDSITTGTEKILVDEMLNATDNGSRVVYTTLGIEHQCAEIITAFLFKNDDPKADFFRNMVIETSWCSFENKRKMLFEVLSKVSLLEGKRRAKYEEAFSKVLEFRNAFAHGKIYQKDSKVYVSYFKGAPKEAELNDEFWNSVEANLELVFSETQKILAHLVEKNYLDLDRDIAESNKVGRHFNYFLKPNDTA